MTQKKNYLFGLIPDGNIIAQSGNYGTYLPATHIEKTEPLIDSTEVRVSNKPIVIPSKLKWYHRFIQWLVKLFGGM